MRLSLCAVALLFPALSAFGQIDAASLRSKYGAPIDRETFTVRPGVQMIVDYGRNKQVCQIQLPSGMQIVGTAPTGVVTKQQIDDVLNEVAPPSVRGKEINRGMLASGAPMLLLTDYEHVMVSELKNGEVGAGITLTFKYSTCPKKTVR